MGIVPLCSIFRDTYRFHTGGETVAREMAVYVPIPETTAFKDENGTGCMEQVVMGNYECIRSEANRIIRQELERIENDPKLKHLILQLQGAPSAK